MTQQKKSKALHITLWVVQILLAVVLGMIGFMKITQPIDQLAAVGMGFVNHVSEGMVRFIGTMEILGALGLILPSALRIMPFLTPAAAAGIAVIMVLAVREHWSQGEPITPNLAFLALAAFVAWGRYKKEPIPAK